TNTLVLYNRDLSDAELTLVRGAIAGSAGVALDPKRVLVVEGSSSAAGYFSNYNQDYSWRSRFLRNDVAYNFARGGDDGSSNGPTDIRTQAAATVDTVVQPGKPNLLILQIGANDLAIYPPGTGTTTSDTARATQIFN
ncbi:SGNH/GDSL hydrolase family protein, partial [Paenibacillus aquistagni]|uniref:SGNH/GDSL hydrolase family protein n=1 Tax=Paenibacillus aquistagni TaxID=1852522 RepID=UPI00145B1705